MPLDNQLAALDSNKEPGGATGDAAPESQAKDDATSLDTVDKVEARKPLAQVDKTLADKLQRWASPQTKNIAEEISDARLSAIGMRVVEEFKIDEDSRHDWLKNAQDAIQLAAQVMDPKTTPWENASNICYPLIGTAAIQFSARAFPAIVAGADVVKGITVGEDDGIPQVDKTSGLTVIDKGGNVQWQVPPGDKRHRADRIGQHMSWQCTEEMPEWEEETDKLLTVLPIVGCEFRKSYFDSDWQRNCSVRVAAEYVVVNYRAKSLDTAPRITEVIKLYPVEIEEMIRAGLFLEHDYNDATTSQDKDNPREFLEQHRRLDLDEDGYPEPYIVIVHKESMKVARIIARFDPEGVHFSRRTNRVQKIDPVQYYTKFDFLKNPDGGIYGVGFGHYLGHMNKAINSSLNQLFDAGTLQNTGGGFIGKGLSMAAGAVKLRLGEWKLVNALGNSVRESIVPLVHPGPSDTIFKLLGLLIQAGEKMASVNEVLTGQQSMANVPATTTLALIEQGLKVFTAIYKRVHTSLKQEFQKLYRLNRIYLEDSAKYRRGSEWRTVTRKDYLDGAGVAPISDPSMVSDMQMLGRAEFLKQFLQDPFFDGMEVRRRMLEAAKISDIDKLLKPNQKPDPAILIKMAELRLKRIQIKAAAVSAMSVGILNLAKADATIATTYLAFVKAQMDAIVTQVGQMGDDDGEAAGAGGPTGPAGGGDGNIGGGLPAMAPPPGDQMAAPVPQ